MTTYNGTTGQLLAPLTNATDAAPHRTLGIPHLAPGIRYPAPGTRLPAAVELYRKTLKTRNTKLFVRARLPVGLSHAIS
jgi:hypothetical protein